MHFPGLSPVHLHGLRGCVEEALDRPHGRSTWTLGVCTTDLALDIARVKGVQADNAWVAHVIPPTCYVAFGAGNDSDLQWWGPDVRTG